MAIRAAEMAFPAWRATPAPRRGEILYRFGALLAEHKERLARPLTREMGKVLDEARGDVQEAIDIAVPDGGGGAPAVRRHRPLGAARQVGDEHPRADRRGRAHHALELPDGHPVLEDDAGARHRQHRRASSRRRTRPPARRCSWSCWPRRASRRASSTSSPAVRRRRSATRSWSSPDVPVISLHGQRRDRARHRRAGRRAAQARCPWSWAARTPSSCWTTRTWTSPWTASCGRAFGTTGQRCTACSRRDRASARVAERLVEQLERAGARAAPGRRPATGHRRRAAHQRARPATRSRATSRSAGARATAGLRRRARDRRRPGARPLLRSRRSSTASTRCPGWARRRSSGRCCRSSGSPDYEAAVTAVNQVRYGLSSSIYTRDVNTRVPGDARPRRRASCTSTRAPSARRRTCRSAARADRQRPPRGGPRGARHVHGVEVDLRRLLAAGSSGPRSTTSRAERGAPSGPGAPSAHLGVVAQAQPSRPRAPCIPRRHTGDRAGCSRRSAPAYAYRHQAALRRTRDAARDRQRPRNPHGMRRPPGVRGTGGVRRDGRGRLAIHCRRAGSSVAEQWTLNPRVEGSNPSRLTTPGG